jgi:hypothetical protein
MSHNDILKDLRAQVKKKEILLRAEAGLLDERRVMYEERRAKSFLAHYSS